ncbi:Low-affinity iron/zinc ion transport protein fet4 [Bienertia sinuspersici]
MAHKCGAYKKIIEFYCLIPHSTLDEKLRRVYNDKEVLEMEEVVLKHKGLDLYVVQGVDVPEVIVCVPEVSFGVPKVSDWWNDIGPSTQDRSPPNRRKKTPYQKGPTTSPIASYVRTSLRLNKSLTIKDKSPLNEDQQTTDINTTTPASFVVPQNLQTQNCGSTPAASKKAPTPAYKPFETTLQPPSSLRHYLQQLKKTPLHLLHLSKIYHMTVMIYLMIDQKVLFLSKIYLVTQVVTPLIQCMNQRVKGQINGDEDFEQENEDFKEEIPFELNEANSSNDELRKARNKVRKRNA